MKINDTDVKKRLDVYVSEVQEVTRSCAQGLIDDGYVLVNGKQESKNYRLRQNDDIEIEKREIKDLEECTPEDIPLDIVYEDSDIIVINKPSGMVVHPAPGNESGTLVNALLFHCKNGLSGINGVIRPGIVHRIDKDTSGLLVVAKNDESHVFLSSLLKDHNIKREYHAILTGHLREHTGTVRTFMARHPVDRKKMAVVSPDRQGAREAITHYSVIEEYRGYTYAKMELETGRTHQIRVHCAYLGHPIIGDEVYGGGKTQFEKANKSLLCGQVLHAKRLTLIHPRTKQEMTFECQLPKEFSALLERLKRLQ
ncbi:MAG: RluA family pseudouridine synthase [Clostridia bacterium]|nr:RluA family pseudouridine synthase [Clostridia bacterium]